MFYPLERRRFNRLIIPLPIHYQTQHPESGELYQGQGIIRDISLSGSFFHLDHDAPFQHGQILSLTIMAPLPFLDNGLFSHFSAQAEVVRLEPPGPSDPRYGVAVNFLQNLSFAPI
jgi:c-di-GMP-binding flagellar brake protein YcgR